MIASTYDSVRAEPWKELILQLPGIMGVEFMLENDAIREVHVLADQSRSAKQVVRDIQSAMLARFQVELDHRLVSVARVPGSISTTHSRAICDHLEISTGRDGSSAVIYLTLDGRNFSGEAHCDLSTMGRFRSISLATVSALNQLLEPHSSLSLEEVRSIGVGEHQAVLVGLLLKYGGKTESLLGACYEGQDPNFSVALATLDAVNRRLSILPRGSTQSSTD